MRIMCLQVVISMISYEFILLFYGMPLDVHRDFMGFQMFTVISGCFLTIHDFILLFYGISLDVHGEFWWIV